MEIQISAADFKKWIKNANTGQTIIYYTGRLDVDRGACVEVDGYSYFSANEEVDALGTLAYGAFSDRKVHLFQRKLRDNVYQYIAMKRSPYGRNW